MKKRISLRIFYCSYTYLQGAASVGVTKKIKILKDDERTNRIPKKRDVDEKLKKSNNLNT